MDIRISCPTIVVIYKKLILVTVLQETGKLIGTGFIEKLGKYIIPINKPEGKSLTEIGVQIILQEMYSLSGPRFSMMSTRPVARNRSEMVVGGRGTFF